MPPLPTDAQLKAGFTQLEHQFLEWTERNYELWSRLVGDFDLDGQKRLLQSTWPAVPQIEEKYYRWHRQWYGRFLLRMQNPMTENELIDEICKTNFTIPNSLAHFRGIMELSNTPDLVFLGDTLFGGVFTAYAFRPGCNVLWPHTDIPDGQTLHRCVMAMNLDVPIDPKDYAQPASATSSRRRRQDQRSSGEDSTRSADSGDIDRPQTIVFAQLGVLYYFAGNSWQEARARGRNAMIKGPWAPTKYAVVVQIDSRGKPGAVCVTYNYHRFDEDSNEAVHIPYADEIGLPDTQIGRLMENCTETFTVAKIAGSLNALKWPSNGQIPRFRFQVGGDKEFQIVRTVLVQPQGAWIIPQVVKKD